MTASDSPGDLHLLLKSVSFTEEEKIELKKNFSAYSEVVRVLLMEIKTSSRIKSEINRLGSESASINFETYEIYAALQSSAVRLGGTLASIKLAGGTVDPETETEAKRLLDRYAIPG